MQPRASRGWRMALAVVAVLLAAFALTRWIAGGRPRAVLPPAALPSPRLYESPSDATRSSPAAETRRARQSVPASPVPQRTERSPSAAPTLPVFDLAALPRTAEPRTSGGEREFATNQWFTEQDLRHPEIYFEMARRMPELNRAEERRDTLDFFLTYREKLHRDLEAAGKSAAERREIAATMARYDDAIARLRALIAAASPGR